MKKGVGKESSLLSPVFLMPRHLTFGDIWCLFVSFGPAPHIYQRGERVGEPVCTIHGHYPGYLAVGPAGQHGTGEHAPPYLPTHTWVLNNSA